MTPTERAAGASVLAKLRYNSGWSSIVAQQPKTAEVADQAKPCDTAA